jgi:hypothetical protein
MLCVSWTNFSKYGYLFYMPILNPFALEIQYNLPPQGEWSMFYILSQWLKWICPRLSLQRFNKNMLVIFVSNGTPNLINSIILPLYFNSNFMHITVVFCRLLKFLFSLYFTSSVVDIKIPIKFSQTILP